jgi:maltose alpha-D-glucosyltransferase/alpha-amylase
VRNVIHVRKAHPVFGLGTLEVAETDQESVLAFVRSYEGEGTQFGASAEDVLCVFSFAHNPSAVTVTAPHLAGRTLFDLFGGAQFPSFDEEGKVTITLGTQQFFWLHVGDVPAAAAPAVGGAS